jgi:transposase
MAVTTRLTGSKGTQRTQLVLTDNAKDIADTLHYAASQASFEAWIAEVEIATRSILKEAGLDPDRPVITSRDEDEQTSAYYADRILWHIKRARSAIAKGDARRAAYFSVRLGYLVCEHDMKAYDDTGFLCRQGKKGRGPDKAVAERNKRMTDEFLKRMPTSKVSASGLKQRIGKKERPPLRRQQSNAVINPRCGPSPAPAAAPAKRSLRRAFLGGGP